MNCNKDVILCQIFIVCRFSLFACPCVFVVVSGLETTFLEYSPFGQVTFRFYLPGYVFTRQTPPLPHPVKCAGFLRPSECEKVLICLLNIFCQKQSVALSSTQKMTILLVILANNLQFTISQWQVPIQTLCFSFLFWSFHF